MRDVYGLIEKLAKLGTVEIRRDLDSWNVAVIHGGGRWQCSATSLYDALTATLGLASASGGD